MTSQQDCTAENVTVAATVCQHASDPRLRCSWPAAGLQLALQYMHMYAIKGQPASQSHTSHVHIVVCFMQGECVNRWPLCSVCRCKRSGAAVWLPAPQGSLLQMGPGGQVQGTPQ